MKNLTPAMLTFVMFGVIGMLVVGYVAKSLIGSQEKKAPPRQQNIPMAITDIKPGTIITEKHLGLGKMEVELLTREMLLTNRVIVGRAAKTLIKAAEPIKANQLYQPNELPPLEVLPGMRAVTVNVSDAAAMLDGMIRAGDHVDVLFTTVESMGTGSTDTIQGGLTMRLFEGVKILLINRSLGQGVVERGNNHVTLELTEAQANMMVLARDRGKITLTLNQSGKGDGGVALSNADRVTFYEILGLVRGEKAKDPILTEIYRGSSRATLYFNEQGRFLGSRYLAPQGQDQSQQYVLPKTTTTTGPQPMINSPSTNSPMMNSPAVPAPTTSLPEQPQDGVDRPRAVPTASLPHNSMN